MIKILIIIFYFLCGYICFKNGIDAYGGKDAYLSATSSKIKDYYMVCIVITLLWPFLTIKYIMKKVREHDE